MLSLLLVAALTTPLSIAESPFRKDYQYIEGHDAFYKVHVVPHTWYKAYLRCSLEGASLFYPKTSTEAAFLRESISGRFPKGTETWVGAHDLFVESIFVDDSGNDISEYVHTQWAPGEPNDYYGNENCALMQYDGRLNDVDCKLLKPFVCKRVAQNITHNTACDTWDLAYMPNKNLTRCYKFHKIPKSWTDAFMICRAEQSYLAIVNDNEEADFIIKGVKAVAEDVYGDYNTHFIAIGLHDKFEKGVHLTIHGEKMESVYNAWVAGQPNERDDEDCGSLSMKALISDVSCESQRILFVCERDI